MEIECITDQKYYANKTKNRPKKKKQEKSQKHKINLKNIDKLNELEKRINDVNTSNSDNTGNEKIDNNEKLESDDNNDNNENNEKQEMIERTQSVLIPTQKQFNLPNNLSPLSPKSYPYWKQYSWYNKLDQICEKDLIRLEFQSPPSSLPFQKNEDNLHKNNDNFLNIGNGISMEIEEIPNFETPNSLKSSNCSSNENSNLIFWGKNFNKDINQPSFNEDVSFNFDFFNQDSDVPPDIFFF
ncbi:hypothetical protein M0813_14875 [Anaeramoeba flamelloides]|uniref:Uncharacterized protein n=1 Tax=Anaeramoeba flamelloides TaxID=1746091 RepID=A0ABQ8Z467_9EUKA|nr:hypothetical protein M0813_14875 [Anaeramoeba flamelloides]